MPPTRRDFDATADPGPCTFTLVNDRPAPFPAAGTPQPALPPHDFREAGPTLTRPFLWRCARCQEESTHPGACRTKCPGTPPDPAPPQSLAEAWRHHDATLECLAAGPDWLPQARATTRELVAAVRAECVRTVRSVAGALMVLDEDVDISPDAHKALRLAGERIDALDLGGPPA